MKTRFSITSAALLLVAAGATTAFADCDASQKNFNANVLSGKLRAEHFRPLTKDLRHLRKSAAILGRLGKDEMCEQLVQTMESLASNPPKHAALRPIGDLGGKIRVDEIMDAEVRSSENEYIGSVEDLVLDGKGSPAYVIAEFGGFLGIGEEQVVIPFNALQVSPQRDALFVPVTKSQFDKAPRFKRNAINWADDKAWKSNVDAFYQKPGAAVK